MSERIRFTRGLRWQSRDYQHMLRDSRHTYKVVMSRIQRSHVTKTKYTCLNVSVSHEEYVDNLEIINTCYCQHLDDFSHLNGVMSQVSHVTRGWQRQDYHTCSTNLLIVIYCNVCGVVIYHILVATRIQSTARVVHSIVELVLCVTWLSIINATCGMSHLWLGYITYINESYHTCKWVMSHM